MFTIFRVSAKPEKLHSGVLESKIFGEKADGWFQFHIAAFTQSPRYQGADHHEPHSASDREQRTQLCLPLMRQMAMTITRQINHRLCRLTDVQWRN